MWFKLQSWILPAILAAIGLFYLIMGISVLFGKKNTEHNVSGVPFLGGIHFLIAGLISPCKWLAFLCVLDYVVIGTIYKFINPNAYERKNDSIDTESKDENSLK
ncbi:MAG: hypothetical protein IJ232_08690 [Lachnospiraceae bacterium]|nr:hypothetical protein [Lachnospiraceae bacterium]